MQFLLQGGLYAGVLLSGVFSEEAGREENFQEFPHFFGKRLAETEKAY